MNIGTLALLVLLSSSCATTSDYWYHVRCQSSGHIYFDELVRGDQLDLSSREWIVIRYSKLQEIVLESRECMVIRRGRIEK